MTSMNRPVGWLKPLEITDYFCFLYDQMDSLKEMSEKQQAMIEKLQKDVAALQKPPQPTPKPTPAPAPTPTPVPVPTPIPTPAPQLISRKKV